MKHVLLALFLCLGFFASAQTVTIPDPNFKTALLNHDPVIDTNGDGEIQVSEAENCTTISMYDNGISDLTGIEAFVNLTGFSCSQNLFTSIDISENINLEYLILGANPLTTLDISNNINLTYLSIFLSELTEIDVSNNINLTHLDASYNQLTELDISQNTELQTLHCEFNQIETLNLSQNTELQTLKCMYNDITAFNFLNNPNLKSLNLEGMNLSELDLSNNSELEYLDCSETNITSFDFSNNINLKVLFLGGLNLSELDLSNNSELEFLSIRNNNFTEFDFSNLSELKITWFSNNPLTEVDLSNNVNLCHFSGANCFNLEYINLKNIGNQLYDENFICTVYSFGSAISVATPNSLLRNSNLKFICVDDVTLAEENIGYVPPQTAFVEDCSIANGDLNTIEGIVRYDESNDGCDSNDLGAINLLVNTTDGTHNFANRSTETGDYRLTVSENTYTTTVLGLSPYFTLTPSEQADTFVGFNQTKVADFCISPAFTANDLTISIIPTDIARPGFQTTYTLTYENVGNTTLSGDITLEFDESRVSFLSASPSETSQVNNTITWSYNNVQPFESKSISIDFSVMPPPTNESGDILSFTATANPVNTDETPDDNVFELNQEVVNSFDPNDKQVAQGSQVLIDKADEYLHYIVRFQNMGTASAINVRVQDDLDELLDWTTLKILDSSHEMNVEMVDGKIGFIFNDIDLPTEDTDPEASQGYVTYKIKPLPGIEIGDEIENTASIYFDFNAAIITNTVSTTYVDELGVDEYESSKIKLYPNPAEDIVTVEAISKIKTIEILNVLGQTLHTKAGTSNTEQISVSELQTGNYFVKVITEEGNQTIRLLKE